MNDRVFDILLFDLGNVVFGTDNDTSIRYWAELKELDPETLRQRYLEDNKHAQFEKGLITPTEYYQYLCGLLQIGFTFAEFVKGWNLVYRDTFPDVEAELKRLYGSYTIAAFTNTNEVHNEIWPQRYQEVLKYFDKIFVSSDMKLRKPEKEAFQFVLSDLKSDPNKILFFDDREENIAAAEKLGLTCVLVHSSSDVSSRLKQIAP